MPVALVTNVHEYAGPGIVQALTSSGWTVMGHDRAFTEARARAAFEEHGTERAAAAAVGPDELVAECAQRFGRIDALISNDIPHHALDTSREADPFNDFEALIDALVVQPARLLRAALPLLTESSGVAVMITSGAPIRNPGLGGPYGYTAARAATNSLVKAAASEVAGSGVRINAVAPFMLYSQTFFPSEVGETDPRFETFLSRAVPMRRFGLPTEIGALVAFLVSGDCAFVSGQVIAFSGAGC